MLKCVIKKVLFVLILLNQYVNGLTRPNVVFILADDMGWNDVSYHGSDQFYTPNIDTLAYSGISLHNLYSHSVCTPTRSALLTGKYAYKLGTQGHPIVNGESRGLPLKEKLLPQYLKDYGYSTHLVGKWHLGRFHDDYLPQNRGFDSYFGHLGGVIDYYEHDFGREWIDGTTVNGFDLYRNNTPAYGSEGYLTDIYTKEANNVIQSLDTTKPLFLLLAHQAPHAASDAALLQAPAEVVRSLRHISLLERRLYAAMVKKLDDSIGEVIKSLHEKNILNHTIIIFQSDNGGITAESKYKNWASNWPLRGLKLTPWEGGIRVPGFLWTPNLLSNVYKSKIHVSDWLPTIIKAIGGDIPKDIDGVDNWINIIENKTSNRDEIIEINDYYENLAMISGPYKLVTGKINCNEYYGGDLRQTSFDAPTYIDSIKESVAYKVLSNLGYDLKNDEIIRLREENIVKITINNTNDKNYCRPIEGEIMCLFNIEKDPLERYNIAISEPAIFKKIQHRLQEEWLKRVPRKVPFVLDHRAKPGPNNNYTWSTVC